MTRWFDRWLCRSIDRYQRKGGGRTVFTVDCNFSPTCSAYAKEAITTYGTFRALPLIISRIRRCNNRDLVDTIDDPMPERTVAIPEEEP